MLSKSDQNNVFSCTYLSPGERDDELYGSSMCVADNKFIYITGGHGRFGIKEKCNRFDIARNTWNRMY